jgi:hypothetical protein
MNEDTSWFTGIIEALDLESVKLERMVVQSEILRDGVIALVAERDALAAKLAARDREVHKLRVRFGIEEEVRP